MKSKTRNIGFPEKCGCSSTNCLKLYCVCFAANRHCTEACSCQECYNLLDYKDKVEFAREKARKRKSNPISAKEGVNPTIEKYYQIGCRCSKIMCKHNSCTCFKAKVGCLPRCQCVGCQNDYGKKEDK